MNAKSENSSTQNSKNKKKVKAADGLNQIKIAVNMQASGKVNGKSGTLPGGTLSKYCWQSNDLEQLANLTEKLKQKNGI